MADKLNTDSRLLDYSIDAVPLTLPRELYAVYMSGYKVGRQEGISMERALHSETPFGVCATCEYYDFTECSNKTVRDFAGRFKPSHDFGCNQYELRACDRAT